MDNSRILSEEPVFNSKYFHIANVIYHHKGKTFTKDVIARRSVVLVIPLTSNNEIYLVSQYRVAQNKITLELVTGTIDANEKALDTAKRELEEEAGLTATEWKFLTSYKISATAKGEAYIFVAKGLEQGKTNQDEDEDIKTVKIPLDEAINKAKTGEINVASNAAALLLLDDLLKEGKI